MKKNKHIKKRKNLFKLPSNNFIFTYCSIAVLIILLVSLIIPVLLNYPPGSINTEFDIHMAYSPYYMQFTLGGLLGMLVIFSLIKFLLRDIDKWYQLPECKKYSDIEFVQKIRNKCVKLPKLLLLIEFLIPTICALIIFFSTGSHLIILFVKLCILLICIGLLLAVISYIFTKKLYNQVLADTYKKNYDIGKRTSLRSKIFIQILPLIIICILISFLVSFSRSNADKSDFIFDIYSNTLKSHFNIENTYTIENIKSILKTIPLLQDSDSTFIIMDDKTVIPTENPNPSNFVIEYTLQLSEQYNGRTYDTYGLETSGATIKLKTSQGTAYVGILFTVMTHKIILHFTISAIVLIVISIITIYMFAKGLIDDLHFITDKFEQISKNANIHLLGELPIISNDEIGDLNRAFNNIQSLTKENIEEIHNKQDMLIEKERLASLGQMIGGIAHNLKTPIMSIGGASQGLSDLIKEYDTSIDDTDVTKQDHHEIAKEMADWVNKIKIHTEYMSDVITAVKGQAVKLSDEQVDSFSIEELLKHVTILMKHELKNALIELNVIKNIDTSYKIRGNINILVQVINNIISNAIQAYKGEPNKAIDFEIREAGLYIEINIKDYASGISPETQNKLFKEMVTTKGKNGTGLGLFMSYSTIKANFNGQLSFESELGKGTTFTILIPKISI